MNIKSATEQIEGAVRAYLAKDDEGAYLIPLEMQRPLILMGPPGVGKTAIAAQVAERLHLNFVSYAITHHTRQSALGLPYIDEESFDGVAYKVSRYTMSEIIAATYDAMRRSDVREGILFLDEINCASETLMPSMLQFLQYKTFGQHRLPQGWVVVTAGNPPAYNRAARDFDPAMLDRLKRIDIEPDLKVWMEYAVAHAVHPAITSYLEAKPDRFYLVRASVSGTRIVTARGWEDLSRMIGAYERVGLAVDLDLIGQYLQDPDTAEDFSLYLELFNRYKSDYRIGDVLAGTADEGLAARARRAGLDERMALVGLLSSALLERVRVADVHESVLRDERAQVAQACTEGAQAVNERLQKTRQQVRELEGASSASEERLHRLNMARDLWERLAQACAASGGDVAVSLRGAFNDAIRSLQEEVELTADQTDNVLDFAERSFGESEETLVLCSKLASDPAFMRFEAQHPSTVFQRLSKQLMLQERGLDLLQQVDELQEVEVDGTEETKED